MSFQMHVGGMEKDGSYIDLPNVTAILQSVYDG